MYCLSCSLGTPHNTPVAWETSPTSSRDVVEAGLVSTASMLASIPASGASLAESVRGGAHDFRALDPCMEASGSDDRGIKGLVVTQSENAGGLRGYISTQLASSLSYKPTERVSGEVTGGHV